MVLVIPTQEGSVSFVINGFDYAFELVFVTLSLSKGLAAGPLIQWL
jgi:hypothetical protein